MDRNFYFPTIKWLMIGLLMAIVSSCSLGEKKAIDPKTKFKGVLKKTGQTIIDLNTNDCHALGGYIIDGADALAISAIDADNGYSLLVMVWYNDIKELTPGKSIAVTTDENFNFPAFRATVLEHSTNKNWQTDVEGYVNGSLTLRSFDNSTGLASFDISFDAKVFSASGTKVNNQITTFAGSFENIPIFPDSDSWSDCDKSIPGFGTGGGGTGGGGGGTGGGGTGGGGTGGGGTGGGGTGGGGTGGGGTGGGGGGGTGGSTNTGIKFINKTAIAMDITFNGETRQIPYGGEVTFTGKAGNRATGTASSGNKTTTGEQIGLKLTWELDYNFPTSGNLNVNLNVNSQYFFLKLQNKSGTQISKLLVNYGLQSQSQDNILIPADNVTYNIGYYKAFTNTTVRAESNDGTWTWSNLALPFTENQTKTLIANP